MALGIKSIAAIVGLSAAGIGAVSGIGYGIHVATTSQHIETNEIENTSKPSKPQDANSSFLQEDANKDAIVNDDSTTSSVKVLDEVAKSIAEAHKKSSLVTIYPIEDNEVKKEKAVEIDKVFPYLIESKQVELKIDQNLLQKTTFSFDISKTTNTITSYSQGELHLTVKLENIKDEIKKEKEFDLVVTGFKKTNSNLKNKLLSKDETSDFVLDLTSVSKTSDTYLTIEDLNSISSHSVPKKTDEVQQDPANKNVSGLTNLVWVNKSVDDLYLADLIVEGKVKLEKIVKDAKESKPIFYLTSQDQAKYLRLVKADSKENETEEVLIKTIKISNLIATDITVAPKSNVSNKKIIEEALVDSSSKNYKGYFTKKTDRITKDSRLWINLKSEDTNPNKLFIDPYIVEKNELSEDGKLPIDINLIFGAGTTAKTYSTSDKKQQEILSSTGFSFDLHSKSLGEENKNETIEANVLKDAKHKLAEQYFKEGNEKKFVQKVDANKPAPEAEDKQIAGEFYRETINEKQLKDIKLNLQDSIGKTLEDISLHVPSNYLLLVGYRYGGIKENYITYPQIVSLLHVKSELEKA